MRVTSMLAVGYCLNPEHPRGKHKARVFATLGFAAESADDYAIADERDLRVAVERVDTLAISSQPSVKEMTNRRS